jgi:type VI protein secretion system component VasF
MWFRVALFIVVFAAFLLGIRHFFQQQAQKE